MLDCATDPALVEILLPGDERTAAAAVTDEDAEGAVLGWATALLALAIASAMIPWP